MKAVIIAKFMISTSTSNASRALENRQIFRGCPVDELVEVWVNQLPIHMSTRHCVFCGFETKMKEISKTKRLDVKY